MGIFEPQPRRTDEVRARVPKSLKKGIERLAKVWTHVERLKSEDEDVEVTEADVVNRLLTHALDGAWAEIGFEPLSDEQVEDAKRVAAKALAELRTDAVKRSK